MHQVVKEVDYQQIKPLGSWSLYKPWPLARYCWLVFALYLIYLPLSGADRLFWDSVSYWDIVSRFFIHKKNPSLLNFNSNVRGYVGPLLIAPVRIACTIMNWKTINGSKFIGMVWATLLFGYTIPELWRVTLNTRLQARTWLLIVGLGFTFWGDYFNYCLQDFPALTALLLSLLFLARPGFGAVFMGGVLLAASFNMRPIYMSSSLGALGWLWWHTYRRTGNNVQLGQWVGVGVYFVLGIALVLVPQALINYRHFHHFSPLVLINSVDRMPFYLTQLNWGVIYQRYDSSISPLHYGGMLHSDPAGIREAAEQSKGYFDTYGAFLAYYISHPVSGVGHFLRHLFNGLDVDYCTPYPAKAPGNHITGLQLLNYNVVALGAGLLGYSIWRAFRQPGPKLYAPLLLSIAILLPVLLAVPTAIEVRFVLPLHLLLLVTLAANFQLLWRFRGRPAMYLILGASLGLATWGGMQLSTAAQQHLLPPNTLPATY